MVDAWTVEDGLPLMHIRSSARDRDGVVWVATFDGLVRFDGHEMQTLRVDDPLGPHANRLIEIVSHPSDGSLWLLSSDHRMQRRDGDDLWTLDPAVYGAIKFLPTATQQSLLGVMDNQTLLWLDAAPEAIPLSDDLVWVAARSDDGLMAATSEQVGLLKAPGPGAPWEPIGPLPPWREEPVRSSASGRLRVGPNGSHHYQDGTWQPLPTLEPFLRISQPTPSRWGVLGYGIYYDGQLVLDVGTHISYLDPDGDVAWVSSQGKGLLRIRPASAQTHRAPDGEQTNVQRLWWEDAQQVLWAQGEHQGWWPVYSASPEVEPLPALSPEIEQLCPGWTRRFFTGDDGARWLSCVDWVFRPGPEGWAMEDVPDRHQTGPVWETPSGTVLGGERRAYVRLDGQWQPILLDGEPVQVVFAAAELPSGALLLGTGDGVLQLAPGSRAANSLGWQTGVVRHLRLADRQVWMGTEERGLCVADLSAPASAPRCLLSGTIHASIPDGLGRVWVSSNHGIGVLPLGGLQAFAAGGDAPRALWIDDKHGMYTAEANGFVGDQVAKTPDGRLWFASQDGAVSIDPGAFSLPEAPAVLLRAAVAGEQKRGDFSLPTDHDTVELRWSTAATPWVDQVFFRHRLSPAHPWSAPTQQRSLSLPTLAPGESQLQVQAILGNNAGEPATLRIHRAPALHERGLFPLLVALGVVGALLGGAVGYSRYLARRNRELEAQVAARTERLKQQNSALNRSNAMLALQSTELESQNHQLAVGAEELRARNAQIASLAEQLEQLDVLKRQLIANASHELRTPLSLILAPLSATLEDEALPASSRRHVSLAVDNARRLQELIGQLFELSRAQAGGIALSARRTDLGALIEELGLRFEPLAAGKSVTLCAALPDQPLQVWLDRDLIDKVLSNLLSNALRVSPADTTLSLRLRKRDEDVLVEVEDEGPGVPADEQASIFRRFFQTGDTRTRGGGGLGLTLARELVELHGGQIGVRDGEVGACFWFSLPLGAAHLAPHEISLDEDEDEAEAAPAPADPPDAARHPVLLVEDHPQLRAFLAESLSSRFAVHTAEDGQAAIEALDGGLAPALVISDVMMPRMDGHTLARRLRDKQPQLPILFISARQELADRVEGLELGDDYLPKPFQVPELIARALALLRRRAGPQPQPEAISPAAQLEGALRDAGLLRLGESGFNVGALAKAMAMSPRTLQLKMQEHGLPPPGDWLRALRLEQGKALLQSGKFSSVSEVAAEVGMSRPYFSRLYRAQLGRPPGEDLQKASV